MRKECSQILHKAAGGVGGGGGSGEGGEGGEGVAWGGGR